MASSYSVSKTYLSHSIVICNHFLVNKLCYSITQFIFLTGKPHVHLCHPDYIPSVFPEEYNNTGSKEDKRKRLNRRVERQAAQSRTREQTILKEEAEKQVRLKQVEAERRHVEEEKIAKNREDQRMIVMQKKAIEEGQAMETQKFLEELERQKLEKKEKG